MTWHPDDPYDAKALRRGEVVEMLRSAVAAAPSARDWARDNAVSETAVSQILRGRIAPTVSVLRVLGLGRGYVTLTDAGGPPPVNA